MSRRILFVAIMVLFYFHPINIVYTGLRGDPLPYEYAVASQRTHIYLSITLGS